MNTCSTCHQPRHNCSCVDEMVERTSVPSLASLFRAGREQGLIAPAREYTS